LSTTVLQGSVATGVNYGKIFNDFFIAKLLLSVMVKEFWRSVRIRQNYGKKSSGTFFPDTVYIQGSYGQGILRSLGKQRGSGKSQGILKYRSLDQLFMHYFHRGLRPC